MAWLLTRLAVAVRVIVGLPPMPLTVKLYVPLATEPGTEMFSVDEFPVAGFGLKVGVAPDGRPLVTDRLTPALNPPVLLMFTV